MLTLAFYGALALGCMIALSDWRRGVYVAILLDFLRDPVRKLDPNESVLITVSVLGLWGMITIGAWNQSQPMIREFLRDNPKILAAFRLLVIATIPGCALSLLLYSQGYKIMALGLVSYLAPMAGILLGVIYPRYPEEIEKFLRFYCVVNGIALVSVLAEYLNWGWPALGGLKGMHWIRYSATDIVNLIGGFYRSPDIMGLHAAQVAMFSLVLVAFRPRRFSWGWLVVTAFACLCLLLSGRRKMLGMPAVFCAAFAALAYARRMNYFNVIAVPILSLIVAVVGIYFVLGDEFVADEYSNFAATLVTDGATRSRDIVVGSTMSTIRQTGLFGSGIGSATQGSYLVVSKRMSRGWQEDGASRIFKELGVIGVIFVVAAVFSLVTAIQINVRRVPASSLLAPLQLMLIAIAIANLCSFMISHQQYSGDPPSAIIVLLVLGMSLAMPRLEDQQGHSL